MPHRFEDAERWAKVFEAPTRDQWQRPDAVFRLLDPKSDWRVADIGSGTGYFAVRFSRRVARVWGIDIEQSMVDYLNKRAKLQSLHNLTSILGGVQSARLPEPVDLVFVCNTYHHIKDRVAYFRNLAARLLPKGKLVIVDFKRGKIPVGPPERHRVTPEQLDRELAQAGYQRTTLDRTALPYQYVAIYRR